MGQASSLSSLWRPSRSQKKTLILVRHCESEWNRGQSLKSAGAMVGMVTRRDHPLSRTGLQQALQLQDFVGQCSAIQDAEVLLCSPLTRAAQTAVVGLSPLLQQKEKLRVKLTADARERRNFGGRDSSGTRTGADILVKLKSLLPDASHAFADRVDVAEVEDVWWKDEREDATQMQERLCRFVAALESAPDCVVVVGHSHFFCELFGLFGCHDCFDSDFGRRKLTNGGVVKVTLDFSSGEGRLVQPELLHGSLQ